MWKRPKMMWEEAEADLRHWKVRKELASEGHWSYSLNPDMVHKH